MTKPGPVLAIVGPTASGKTALSLEIAESVGAEVVSIDSAQVYREMDIGTAKPSPEELSRIPHHMIDAVDPGHTLTVAEFREMARRSIESIIDRDSAPLLVGGSGLYFRAVVDPLDFPGTDAGVRAGLEEKAARSGPQVLFEVLSSKDPVAAGRIQRQNTRRIVRALEVIEITGRPFSSFRTSWDEYDSIYDLHVAGLNLPRQELDARIEKRVDAMFDSGLVDEVSRLSNMGCRNSLTSVQALGYAQVLAHVDGMITLQEAVDETKRRTRKFARRQLAWFRADPRVVWFEDDRLGAAEFLTKAAKKGGL